MYLSQIPLSAFPTTATEPTFEEWLDFAATKPHAGKRKCVKPTAFPCGNTCLPSHTKTGKPTNCKKVLTGQAKSHAGWLKLQGQAHGGGAGKVASNRPNLQILEDAKKINTGLKGWEKFHSDINSNGGIKELLDDKTFSRLHDNEWISSMLADGSTLRKIGITDEKGNLQAALKYSHGDDVGFEIDYLATAPWNITGTDPRSMKGAGSRAIVAAIHKSKELGYKGEVSLAALQGAMPFYEKIGFKGSRINMTLSANDADSFLKKMGQEKNGK